MECKEYGSLTSDSAYYDKYIPTFWRIMLPECMCVCMYIVYTEDGAISFVLIYQVSFCHYPGRRLQSEFCIVSEEWLTDCVRHFCFGLWFCLIKPK
jgi:hypothetical protein